MICSVCRNEKEMSCSISMEGDEGFGTMEVCMECVGTALMLENEFLKEGLKEHANMKTVSSCFDVVINTLGPVLLSVKERMDAHAQGPKDATDIAIDQLTKMVGETTHVVGITPKNIIEG